MRAKPGRPLAAFQGLWKPRADQFPNSPALALLRLSYRQRVPPRIARKAARGGLCCWRARDTWAVPHAGRRRPSPGDGEDRDADVVAHADLLAPADTIGRPMRAMTRWWRTGVDVKRGAGLFVDPVQDGVCGPAIMAR